MPGSAITQRQGRGGLVPFVASVALVVAWCVVIAWFSAGTGDESQSLSDGVIATLVSFVQPGFSQMPEAQQL